MAKVTVTLGEEGFEKEYEIRTLPVKSARQWRKLVREPLGRLNDLLGTIKSDMTFETVEDMIAAVQLIVPQLVPLLLDMQDEVFDLLVAYSPALQQDREYLEEHALDEQVIDAFLSVLRLAFPLELLKKFPGPAKSSTLPNLPSRNGESISAQLATNSKPTTPTI